MTLTETQWQFIFFLIKYSYKEHSFISTKAMAGTILFVLWIDSYIQKVQQHVAESRNSGTYGAEFVHIGVKFSGHNEIWV